MKPPGFEIGGSAPSELVDDALKEVWRQRGKGRLASIGIDFDLLARENRVMVHSEIDQFPKLKELLTYATEEKWGVSFRSENLNVIINVYGEGNQSSRALHFHKDSYQFEDEIYGLVAQKDPSAPSLTFKNPANGAMYTVPESDGCFFRLEGDSRFVWKHSCESGVGSRVSITWRWVREEVVAWSRCLDADRITWLQSYMQKCVGDEVSTVCKYDKNEGHKVYRDQNEEFGPRLASSAVIAAPGSSSASSSSLSSIVPVEEKYDEDN